MPFQMRKSFEDLKTIPEDLDRLQSWAKSQGIGFVQAKEQCENLLPLAVERVLRRNSRAQDALSWETWIPCVLEATQQVLGGPQLAVQFHHMCMGDKDLREFYEDVYNMGRILYPNYNEEMLNAVVRPVFIDGLTPLRVRDKMHAKLFKRPSMSSTKMLSTAQELMYEQRQVQKALDRGLKRSRSTRDGDNKRYRVDALTASEFAGEGKKRSLQGQRQPNMKSKREKKQGFH